MYDNMIMMGDPDLVISNISEKLKNNNVNLTIDECNKLNIQLYPIMQELFYKLRL